LKSQISLFRLFPPKIFSAIYQRALELLEL
jgi:hypothetical protein